MSVTPSFQEFVVEPGDRLVVISDLERGPLGYAVAKVVELRWPSGAVQTFAHVKAGQVLSAVEPLR